jgi:hypothetical protein
MTRPTVRFASSYRPRSATWGRSGIIWLNLSSLSCANSANLAECCGILWTCAGASLRKSLPRTKYFRSAWRKPDPLDREAMDHEAFAQSRARVYIGRDEYFQRLEAHASGAGDKALVVLGESGSGKSALLANWALRHRAAHPDDFLLLHFIGGTPDSADLAAMLRRIMPSRLHATSSPS